MNKKILKELQQICPNVKVYLNYNLENCHTYHIKCFAKLYLQVTNQTDLVELIKYFEDKNIKFIILGGGSNTIFSRKIITKPVIHLQNGAIELCKNNIIKTFAGTTIASLIKFCLQSNLSGLEWSGGIPASIGGAVVMNMGAFNYNISQFVKKVTYYYKGEIITIKTNKNLFGYRYSFFKNLKCVILCVEIQLQKSKIFTIQNNVKRYMQIKRQNQPVTEHSCGSVFKNPNNQSVAKLIQSCNLKGKIKGGAQISLKHSNFIINKNNATFQDVFYLIRFVKKVVQKRYNICIFCEVVIQ